MEKKSTYSVRFVPSHKARLNLLAAELGFRNTSELIALAIDEYESRRDPLSNSLREIINECETIFNHCSKLKNLTQEENQSLQLAEMIYQLAIRTDKILLKDVSYIKGKSRFTYLKNESYDKLIQGMK